MDTYGCKMETFRVYGNVSGRGLNNFPLFVFDRTWWTRLELLRSRKLCILFKKLKVVLTPVAKSEQKEFRRLQIRENDAGFFVGIVKYQNKW